MDDLPLELIVHIFQYLNKKEQIQLSTVNKIFHEAVFSPSLWTENEESLEVPPNQIKFFRMFLKQLPWLRYLNVKFRPIIRKERPLINVNFLSVLIPFKNLECLSLQLFNCQSSVTFFPSSLKHISLWDYNSRRDIRFISDDLLKTLADLCPLLEHIEIESTCQIGHLSRQGLSYLLEKVKDTLRTLIMCEFIIGDPVFNFIDCPPNVTTLCLKTIPSIMAKQGKFFDLPCLENIKILSLDFCLGLPFKNEDFYEKLNIPNLEILHLNCSRPIPDVDVLIRFLGCCPSLKVLVWRVFRGYPHKALSELEKFKKERSVKIYLTFTADISGLYGDDSGYSFPKFPNDNFLSADAFNEFLNYDPYSSTFCRCRAPITKNFTKCI